MGWGGSRVGAGKKPKGERAIPRRKPPIEPLQAVEGRFEPLQMVAGRTEPSVVDEVVSAVPPEDLPKDQWDFWHRNAGKAIAQGTLTGRTIEAFRLLCEMDVERRETKRTIDRDGRTFIKVTIDGAGTEHEELRAHPLKSDYSRLCKAVEALLARFKLAPFGKAEAPVVKAKDVVNPWAKVGSK